MLPTRWNWFFDGFRRYVRRYVRKHFHAVRLSNTSHPLPADDAPLLVVLNHPSWWDPMIGVILSDLFPSYAHYAAIDAVMLTKYRAFTKLGFFGVDQTSLRGAAEFLRTGTEILSADRRAVWVTAQGEFADVRTRPLNLRSGVGHLAARVSRGWVVPIAVEYTFWTESKPEAVVRFGSPLPLGRGVGGEGLFPTPPPLRGRSASGASRVGGGLPIDPPPANSYGVDDLPLKGGGENSSLLESLPAGSRPNGKQFTARIEAALTASLDTLNAETATRDPSKFTELLGGTAGVGGVYDAFRRSVAFVRGERFDPSHMPEEKPA